MTMTAKLQPVNNSLTRATHYQPLYLLTKSEQTLIKGGAGNNCSCNEKRIKRRFQEENPQPEEIVVIITIRRNM